MYMKGMCDLFIDDWSIMFSPIAFIIKKIFDTFSVPPNLLKSIPPSFTNIRM